MRCTVEPPRRNHRGDASGCDTVLPAQARTGRPASPDLRQIDGEADYLWYLGTGTGTDRLVFRVSYGRVTGITCGSK